MVFGNPIIVSDRLVSCDGGDDGHHPQIYLQIDHTNKAECPYCSAVFIYKEEQA